MRETSARNKNIAVSTWSSTKDSRATLGPEDCCFALLLRGEVFGEFLFRETRPDFELLFPDLLFEEFLTARLIETTST